MRAAQQGHVTAKFIVGYGYYTGIGIKKDYIKALEYLNDAAYNHGIGFRTALFSLMAKASVVLKSTWLKP